MGVILEELATLFFETVSLPSLKLMIGYLASDSQDPPGLTDSSNAEITNITTILSFLM